MAQADKSTTERSERNHLTHVPLNSSPFLSGSVSFSNVAKRKAGHTVPSAEAPNASEAPEASGAKNAQRKQAAPHVRELPPTSLDAFLGNGTSASSPSGEDTQGPSPVDYNLEIEVEFPTAMVIELQKTAVLRARKIVIGRTLAGRASFKDLQDCLRLHLPAPFSTITLLTRGYFEILFEKEEGARATRKLATVEWSGWALSFSRYSALFRPNEHGAEMLFTHSIKVQFPNLHVQLRTEKALTIMASSIGEVLDIESPDSYIKRPAGPMVTVEVKDINKLAGIIRIPSMVEGAGLGDTIAQRILYPGLPNQCRKCRKFGHLAKNCPLNRSPTQDGNIPLKAPTEWRGKNDQGRNTSAQRWSKEKPKGPTDQRGKGGIRPHKDHLSKEEGTGRSPYSPGNLQHTASKAFATGGEEEKERKLAPPPPTHTSDSNQKMSDCTISPPHRLAKEQKGIVLLSIQESTPRTRLSFTTSELASSSGSGDLANLNPFAGNYGEASRTGLLQSQLEDPGEGWTFQGKRRLPVRLLPPRQDLAETPTHSPQLVITPRERKGRFTWSYTTPISNH